MSAVIAEGLERFFNYWIRYDDLPDQLRGEATSPLNIKNVGTPRVGVVFEKTTGPEQVYLTKKVLTAITAAALKGKNPQNFSYSDLSRMGLAVLEIDAAHEKFDL